MGTTRYDFPYPVAGDSPAGHTQIQALALEVENKLGPIDDQVIANTALLASYTAGIPVLESSLATLTSDIATNAGLIAQRTNFHAMTVVIAALAPGGLSIPWTNTGSETAEAVAVTVQSVTNHSLVLIQCYRSSPGSTALATVWRNVSEEDSTPAATAQVYYRSS